jgi:membrane fusion protein
LAVELGNTVQAGQPLATVIPAHTAFEADLWAASKDVGFIAPGQQVALRLSAFPYQKFGQLQGEVTRVDLSPGDPGGGAVDAAAARESPGEPRYRVVVKLRKQYVLAYGRQQALKAGMTLEADVLQDHRRLIEWVFDPLLSAARGRGE